MDDVPNGDDFLEELIKALGGSRRFEVPESQGEPSAGLDEVDEAGDDVLDFRHPASLEELMALLDSEIDLDRQDQIDEARERRIIAAIYTFGGAGIVASAVTGNVAILALILYFLIRLFRML